MKLNYKRTLLVGFAFFLISAFWQAYDSIMPLMLVNKFGLSQTLSGLVMAIDNVIAVFLLPLFGTLSDKKKTRLGHRTPFILIGAMVAVIAFTTLTFADNAQLANINAGDINGNSATFYGQLFDDNYTVANAEKSLVGDDGTQKEFAVQDYCARILYQKDYKDLSDTEKAAARSWYSKINYEYLTSEGHSAPETVYGYKDGQYFPVEIREVDGESVYYGTLNGEEFTVGKTFVKKAYTNLVNPCLSAYAWKHTTEAPGPFIVFGILLLVTLLAMAIFRSPAVALMPDVTPKPLRSKANAIINLMGTVGGMLVLVLGIVFKTGKVFNQLSSFTPFVIAVCAVMMVALIIFMITVKEPKWSAEASVINDRLDREAAASAPTAEAAPAKKGLSKGELTSLILLLASVALWFTGYNAVTSKYSLYAQNVLQMDFNTTLLIAQGAAIAAYLPVGFIAQKVGRKRCIMTGIIILAVAFGGAMFMTANSSVMVMNIFFALAGIGWATINVNSFPMVVELAKNGSVGKFTGYYYTASMTAQIVTPFLSGALMDAVGSMKPLFPYATVFVILAFITMVFVRHGDSKPVAKTGLEALDVDND